MGKKKKSSVVKDEKEAWCYYCDRVFEHEEVLIQHQKAKHFKCPTCNKKLSTAGGLVVHNHQVHKTPITQVPNAKEGRDSIDYEIYGINGIPEEAFVERAAKKARLAEANADEAPKQATRQDIPVPGQPPRGIGQQVPPQFNPPMPTMMHGQPIPGMGFHPMGDPRFSAMMGGPQPGFPLPHGMRQMQHGGPRMPPHMFGGHHNLAGHFQGPHGAPGGPKPGYPRAPGVPQGPPRHLPPGSEPPSGLTSRIEAPSNGAAHSGPLPGVPPAPVPPLFPAGAAAPPPIAIGPSYARRPAPAVPGNDPPARTSGDTTKEPHAAGSSIANDEELSMEEKRAELAAYKV